MKIVGRFLLSLFGWLFSLGITLGVLGLLLAAAVYHSYNKDLPDTKELANYDPPTVTRLYSADGKLMAEYATEKRIFVPLVGIPKHVINAFLSAEDKNFYSHTGVDITGVARAVRNNVINYGQGKSLVGGSTITQQVVKNFLLSSEKSLERKVKEAILAVRITQTYSKDRILELYLNEIYLGLGSYGVAAAAQNYFGKSLDKLTLEEVALLAAQPKAPNLYHPKRNHDAALVRRNWIIDRMLEDGHITLAEAIAAKKLPITLGTRAIEQTVRADFFSEEVRRKLAEMYGADILYKGGLVVKTTLDSTYQQQADTSLQNALIAYDQRHGYRGPLAQISGGITLESIEKKYADQLLANQRIAAVKSFDAKQATLMFTNGKTGSLPIAGMSWTGAKKPVDKLKVGDVILVAEKDKDYALTQFPEVNGAMVVLEPHTGRVLAMSGGYRYGGTEFNRATQAKRQPGSSFKPFVYMAALENGLTPSTIINDAPVELSQGANQPMWRPQNYEEKYLGPTTLRVGLEKSRNTMTVRIAQMIGIEKCMEIGKRLGIYTDPPRNFSLVLGASETTLLNITNAYGMIANGGKQITPSLIERIDDRHGKTIYRRDTRTCEGCAVDIGETMSPVMLPPALPDDREQVIDPRIAYQITSIMEGVVQRGTATRARAIGKTVAGKTGTTNKSFDTWFVGFSPNLVAGVYVGFDQPRSLGAKETGGSTALPAFVNFMQVALKDTANIPFAVPRGIRFVSTDLKNGWPAGTVESVDEWSDPPPQGPVINEAFLTGGPVYIPGVTPKTVLDALANLPTEFEPEEPATLPWQQPKTLPAPKPAPATEEVTIPTLPPIKSAPGNTLDGLY